MNPLHQNVLLAYQNLERFRAAYFNAQLDSFLQPPTPYFQFPLQCMYSSYFNKEREMSQLSFNKPYMINEPLFMYSQLKYTGNSNESKPDIYNCKVEGEFEKEVSPKKEESEVSSEVGNNIKTQIGTMVSFILNNFGRADKEEIEDYRKLYVHNTILCELFDTLVEKFKSATKCREDMVRFVLRKAISSLRDSLRINLKISSKAASIALCKKYFNLNDEQLIKEELDVENEEELLNFLLPYKKNSRNKTANTRFMAEIFSSEAFYQDYKEYLAKFDGILENENQKKVDKFIEFVESCVQRNSLKDIKRFKRLPWVKVWLEATKIIAYELLNNNTPGAGNAKSKKVRAQRSKSNAAKDSCKLFN